MINIRDKDNLPYRQASYNNHIGSHRGLSTRHGCQAFIPTRVESSKGLEVDGGNV
jgi:hypothetical protein